MKNKYAIFPIAMAGLAFICFLFVLFNMASTVQPLWGKTFVLILPSLILSVVAIFALKGKLDRRKTEFVTLLLSIILVIASFVYVIFLSILTATTVTTNAKFYTRAYEQIEDKDGVEGIFPEKIPENAEDIAFRYNPQFLQGGEWFELSYTTTADSLSDWSAFLNGKAEWIGSNKEWNQMNNMGFYGEDSTRYHLYWDGGFNHGEISYVLIDLSCNRITFHYEDW